LKNVLIDLFQLGVLRAMRKTNSVKILESNSETSNPKTDSIKSSSVSSLRRFEMSMEIDYEKWHDGIGYDLDAIRLASQIERIAIEQMLIHHSPRDWRDIEALAQIDTETARETIKNAIEDPNPAVRVAVTRYAPNLVTKSERSHSIIKALQHAKIFGGLSQILDDIEEYHPAEVKDALIEGLLTREGDVAVLFAAMIFYLYGKAEESFDMKKRPFFLLFNTENKEKRVQVFLELCRQLRINPEKYLT
jgi:HEAT repeat protein